MLISSFKALKRLVQNNFIDFFIAMSLKTIISETLFLWHEKPSCHNDVTCLIGLECCSVLNTNCLSIQGRCRKGCLGEVMPTTYNQAPCYQISIKTLVNILGISEIGFKFFSFFENPNSCRLLILHLTGDHF